MLKHLVIGELYDDLEEPDKAERHRGIGTNLFEILKEKQEKNLAVTEFVQYKDV